MRAIIAIFASLASLGFAHDLGVYGHLFPVIEINPVEIIQRKLSEYEQSGQLEAMQKKMQQQVESSVLRPKPLNLQRTTTPTTRLLTPTFTLQTNVYDAYGNIIYPEGLTINPFDVATYPKQLQQLNIMKPTLRQTLLFFNGDDNTQISWAKSKIEQLDHENKPYKIILTGGDVRNTAEALAHRVYFDQYGYLTNYFSLQYVPSMVYQDKTHFVIQACLPDLTQHQTKEPSDA